MSTNDLKTQARAIQQALNAAFGPSPAVEPSPFTANAVGAFLEHLRQETDTTTVAATRAHLDAAFGKALGSPEPWGYQRTLEFVARRRGFASYAALKAALDAGASLVPPEASKAEALAATDVASDPDTTIYVVEIPHQLPPSVWRALDRQDFMNRVEATSQRSGEALFEVTTPRKLLDQSRFASVDEALAADEPWIAKLVEQFGMDTRIAQRFGGQGYELAPPIHQEFDAYFEACRDWLAHDLSACFVFEGFDAAKEGLHDLSGHGAVSAKARLRKFLIEDVTLILYPIHDLAGQPTPLYHRYARETSPQPAYLELDEHGMVSAEWDSVVGNGQAPEHYYGRTKRWRLSPHLSGDMVNEFVHGEVLDLLKQIHVGHRVEWDGRNHIGVLDDDAEAASDELEKLCEASAELCQDSPVWDPDEYLFSGNGDIHDVISNSGANTADFAAVRGSVMAIDDEVFRVDGGAEAVGECFDAYVRNEVQRVIEEWEPRFAPEFVLGAVAAGVITQEDADDYLASGR